MYRATLLMLFLLISSTFSQNLPPIKLDYSSVALFNDGRILGYYGNTFRVDAKSTGYIAKDVIRCLIATEDRDFYNHDGVSYKGLLRGVLSTVTGNTQGGSTITMQLAKVLFLSSEKTISRKLTQIELAYELERKYSKDQILLLYLNTVYFGHSANGIWAAAQVYFAKTPDKLTLTESATLVGLLQNPGLYDPTNHADRLLKRRNEVLYNLVQTNKISQTQFNKAKNSPLNLNLKKNIGRHFQEYIRLEAEKILHAKGIYLNTGQLKIYTTLHPYIQDAAENAIHEQYNSFPSSMKSSQAALISLDPNSGAILAMVGGNPTSPAKGMNRSIQAKRQPGSTFKPLLYAGMLRNDYTLGQPLLDVPHVVDSGRVNEWRPENDDNSYSGKEVSMYYAIENSINNAAVDAVINYYPADSLAQFAYEVGIRSKIPNLSSIALGTAEVTPIELASVYNVFASGGVYSKPYAITKIEDKNGKVLYSAKIERRQVYDKEDSYLLTSALQNAVKNGTGSAIRRYFQGSIAGKTGTTQNSTDAWFAGYTPTLSTVVWIGFDNPSNKLSGSFRYGGSAAAPIVGRMLQELTKTSNYYTKFNFVRPDDIIEAEICLQSGETASPNCKLKGKFLIKEDDLYYKCSIHDKKEIYDPHYGF